MAALRVVLVDKSPEFLEAAARFLAAVPQLRIVGMARSGAEALALVRRARPDLMLADLSMSDMSGLELARRVKRWRAAPRVIVMSMHDEPEYRNGAALAGADSFVVKSAFAAETLPLIAALFETGGRSYDSEHDEHNPDR